MRKMFGCLVGLGLLTVIDPAVGLTARAQLPEQRNFETERPPAVWTPSSEAPEGTLTHQLEAQRRDAFIERAQEGDIDITRDPNGVLIDVLTPIEPSAEFAGQYKPL